MSNKGKPQGKESAKKVSTALKEDPRPCSTKESLEQSLKEMQLIRQGKLKKRSWKDLKKELQKELENE